MGNQVINGVVLIVEGWSDHDQLIRSFEEEVHTIVTNGTRYNPRVKNLIELAQDMNMKVYILSDPDKAGQDLANTIQRHHPEIERIEVDPVEARKFRSGQDYKYGIEYCTESYLQELLGDLLKAGVGA